MGIEWWPVHRLIAVAACPCGLVAVAACPGGVPDAVAEAGLMAYQHFAGPETVSGAGRGVVGLPVMMSLSFTAVGA